MRTGTRAWWIFFNRLFSSTRAWIVSVIDPAAFVLRVIAWTFLPKSSSDPAVCRLTRSFAVPFLRLLVTPPTPKLLLHTGGEVSATGAAWTTTGWDTDDAPPLQ